MIAICILQSLSPNHDTVWEIIEAAGDFDPLSLRLRLCKHDARRTSQLNLFTSGTTPTLVFAGSTPNNSARFGRNQSPPGPLQSLQAHESRL
jgi:hypothetical protein